MALALALAFPVGRFHATPWGHHVNEGTPEWPPSPWRLLRALVAVWKRTLRQETWVDQVMPGLLGQLAAPPLFHLPPAEVGHTRHYMPWRKGWTPGAPERAKTKVFDTFVSLDPEAEVVVLWPEVQLDPTEAQALRIMLSQLGYFGRAESWCAARVIDDWVQQTDGRWAGRDPATGRRPEVNCVPLQAGSVPAGIEPVEVLAPDPATWQAWAYGPGVRRPEPCWNLLAETADLHCERWSDPPGARWLTYGRPLEALMVEPIAQRRGRPDGPITVARYVLDGAVLPPMQEALSLGELARQYLQGIYGRVTAGRSSALFSGKTADGVPLRGHRHAAYLATDEDGDGRLDHLTVYAPGEARGRGQDGGFGPLELQALDRFRAIRQLGRKPDLRLLLIGLGRPDDFPEAPLLCRSRWWRSATPFVLPRHWKRRGRQRESPDEQLRDELLRRGLPTPTAIEALARCPLAGRSLRWLEFRRTRLRGEGQRGQGLGYGFTLEFPEPVAGPLALGYGGHFGLGLFVPVMATSLPGTRAVKSDDAL